MKIAIVTDSNSGITQKQAQELGVFVLAMPFQIDGETYYEDITLTQEEFYKKLREGGNISTSQPSPGSVTDLWDKITLLSLHDALPISEERRVGKECRIGRASCRERV